MEKMPLPFRLCIWAAFIGCSTMFIRDGIPYAHKMKALDDANTKAQAARHARYAELTFAAIPEKGVKSK